MTALLPENWQVPDEIRDRLGTEVGRQRAMAHDDHLLLVLHAPPTPDVHDRVGRLLWREPDGRWHAHGVRSLEVHLDDYQALVDTLELREEKADSTTEYFEILRDLVPIRRAAQHMHEALQDARAQLPDALDLIPHRDAAGSLERSTELISAEAKNGLDYRLARTAEEQAQAGNEMALAAHRLNHLATVFFPIATLATIFGVNLPSGLETTWAPKLFWSIVGVSVVLGLVLNAIVMSRPSRRAAAG